MRSFDGKFSPHSSAMMAALSCTKAFETRKSSRFWGAASELTKCGPQAGLAGALKRYRGPSINSEAPIGGQGDKEVREQREHWEFHRAGERRWPPETSAEGSFFRFVDKTTSGFADCIPAP